MPYKVCEKALHKHVLNVTSHILKVKGTCTYCSSTGLLASLPLCWELILSDLHLLPIYNTGDLGSPAFCWELVLCDLGTEHEWNGCLYML